MSIASKALWFIESHLNEDLSLEQIAGVVSVSRFHLSRAFTTATGQPLALYLRARRLTEAARRLAGGAPDILAVALEAGYGSHEAFTRAFRQRFGLTPEALRRRGTVDDLCLQEPIRMQKTELTSQLEARFVSHGAILIFGLGQRYDAAGMAGVPAQWLRFVPHLGTIPGQVGNVAYGVICNTDDAGNADYICGVEVKEFPREPAEFTRLRIPPQTYAVFEHRAHISEIGATWKAIWNQALPATGRRAADGPSLERYDEKFDGRTGLGGCEIWIPIQDAVSV